MENRAPSSRISSNAPLSEEEATRRRLDSKEALRIVREMSEILNCGLHGQALGTCIRLIEDGADPVALANLIKKWRSEKQSPTNGNTSS